MRLVIENAKQNQTFYWSIWIDEEKGILFLERIGSHANLFKNKMGKSLPDEVEIKSSNLSLTLKVGFTSLLLD